MEKVDTWIFLSKGEVAVFGAPGYFFDCRYSAALPRFAAQTTGQDSMISIQANFSDLGQVAKVLKT